MSKCVIGIDVGGTNVKFGLVDFRANIVSRATLNTRRFFQDKRHLIDALAGGVEDLLAGRGLRQRDLAGIGIGLPGLVDPAKGVVRFLPNIPGWKNVPLRATLEKRLGMPVLLENDVNMITLGEWRYGAGAGARNIVCITLGTGVGGGLILDGRLYRGEGFAAGEIGHVPLNETGPACNCGGFACFERYVANLSMEKRAAGIFRRKGMALKDVGALAARGDRRALAFWKEIGEHLGNGLVGVVNLLNPQRIVIGGGIANNLKYMGTTIRRVIRCRAMKVQAGMVRVVRARLGDDAGLMGATVLVEETLKKKGTGFLSQ